MPFYRYGKPGEDTVVHLNYGGRRRGPAQCRMPRFDNDQAEMGNICGRQSVALCDSPGCDISICELHRTKHATKPNTDYCSEHKSLAGVARTLTTTPKENAEKSANEKG